MVTLSFPLKITFKKRNENLTELKGNYSMAPQESVFSFYLWNFYWYLSESICWRINVRAYSKFLKYPQKVWKVGKIKIIFHLELDSMSIDLLIF